MTNLIIGLRLAVVAAILALASAPAAADTWVFDKQLTEVRFSWDGLGLARRSGRFLEIDGALDFTPTDPEAGKVEVTIRTSSVSTGTREFDDILKSPDFFGASTFPRITFRSIGIEKTGDKTGQIKGELTVHGVTQPVTLDTTWNFTGEHPLGVSNPTYMGKWVSGFSATTKVLRSDFGIKRAIPLLSDEIRIDIEAVLIRKD